MANSARQKYDSDITYHYRNISYPEPPENLLAYLETEARLQEAVEYRKQHPNVSYQWLETQFRVNKNWIQWHWKGICQSKSNRDPTNQWLKEY
jgi:hypothetical protein